MASCWIYLVLIISRACAAAGRMADDVASMTDWTDAARDKSRLDKIHLWVRRL